MASDVSICTQALGLLGKPGITALTDGSPAAVKCSQFYTDTLDEVLRAHEWNFATTRVQLVQDFLGTPVYGYDYAYGKPADCVKLIKVARTGYELDNDALPAISYKLEGNLILANEEELFCKYIVRVTDAGLFDSLFSFAFAAALAPKLAGAFNLGLKITQNMVQLAEYALANAKKIDNMESGTPQRRVNSSWLDAR